MKVKVELSNFEAVKKFTELVKDVDTDVRLVGKDENGNDWDLSAKSLLCSLIAAKREQMERTHTAHDVDWNTTWCVCEKDIYTLIKDFVVVENKD
ncbi:MAG: hypothetical protein II304_03900 [Bacteroidales bacterium]|nr:hypothetical protein [Bacteroidales bacterium]